MNAWQPVLTLIVAAAALLVSWNYNRSQARIARARLRLDLFEHRMAVYDEVTKYMQHQIEHHGQVEDVTPFLQNVSRAKWLFDESVTLWIEKELLVEVGKLSMSRRTASFMPDGPEKAEKLLAASDAGMHFYDQYRRRDEVFGSFLRIGST